jgi:hypothetical protein
MSARARAGVLGVVVVLVLGAGTLTSVAAAEGVCANEALRGESALNPETQLPVSLQLPDCRAYELVSPTYEGGYPVRGNSSLGQDMLGISGDGSRVLALSLGTFGGTVADAQFGTPYEFVREGSGWVASGLAPSPARFPFQELFAPSEDLTKSVWVVREPSQPLNAEDLYLREPDGSFVKVGPLIAPSLASGQTSGYYGGPPKGELRFVGASSDLSHVLFTFNEPAFFWPFAEGSATLYEYSGTGNSEPTLVGVSGGAGDHTLISKCGTTLGDVHGASGGGDERNAVSVTGATVFFTAVACGGGPSVSELYARIAAEKSLAVSSPSHPLVQGAGEGPEECNATCESATPREGVFQGASRDGSKVFFLTTQPLLNGDTDTETDLYEAEIEGEGAGARVGKLIQVSHDPNAGEAAGVMGVAGVSEDGSHVYFVAGGVLAGADREGRSPMPGAANLYVYERDAAHPQGHIEFVVTLPESDGADWSQADDRPVQVTPDGRFLVFQSSGDLTADDTSTVRQVFEYDAAQEVLVRVSAGQRGSYLCEATGQVEEGYNCDGNVHKGHEQAEITVSGTSVSDSPADAGLGLAVSADGSDVFFRSSDGLTPQAQLTNNHVINIIEEFKIYATNVYEYHSTVGAGGSIAAGNVYLVSDGRDLTLGISGELSGVSLYGTDASGGDVFFSSGDQLVGQDTDTQLDLYDARVGGGFPAPPAAGAGCEGEACQGSASAPPLFGSPGSVSSAGGGNVATVIKPPPPPRVKPKGLTRAQKLARALTVCRRGPRRARAVCEAHARKRYRAVRAVRAGTSSRGTGKSGQGRSR